MNYIRLHFITCMLSTGGARSDLPTEPQPRQAFPQPAAPRTDPALLIGKVCAALHAGTDAYNKAAAAWRAKFPLTAFPDPRRAFLICEGGVGDAQRMRGPANFSRSFAEFMAAWLRTDISYDKGDRLLEVATNTRFNPEHFPSMHGVYCTFKAHNLSESRSKTHVMLCNACKNM